MFGLGIGEGLIILAVVLLVFGGKKLPELGKSMGEAINGFKKGLKDSSEEDNKKIADNSKDDNKNS
ncbi:twin-arginine translocase TatA/TatE family subunit [Halobacteriovorax sp. GB3]|uniref:Sec-independent protein translocase subunit TatA/TatB n=1 Tax=Halobacteriovorax sp. GB3 TaxID=2719615 RepID=UPI00235DC8B1|nr:twin-arginine translocase TatA/TatE family subunit [Halobacteriovorax sp. GB3]MDD0853227.1 twin-arginine translocase TatA/TatE family subunit [Halobacteriovorax sp. GB3]